MQLDLLERIAHPEPLEYKAIGHTPRWEAPSRFAADLEDFVHAVHAHCTRCDDPGAVTSLRGGTPGAS
jgi:hypothetical protein